MRLFRLLLLLALLLSRTAITFGQDEKSAAQSEIRSLIDELAKSAVSGSQVSQFFSPSTRVNQKNDIDSLQKKAFTSFEFINYSWKELEFEDAQHAKLPVTVKWSTRTEEASLTATLKFVKDGGTWYFANADFWDTSIVWWLSVPLMAFSVCYAIGTVIMYRHVERQDWRNSRKKVFWEFVSLVPFAFFFYFKSKPWADA
jgi:hypothetical protein